MEISGCWNDWGLNHVPAMSYFRWHYKSHCLFLQTRADLAVNRRLSLNTGAWIQGSGNWDFSGQLGKFGFYSNSWPHVDRINARKRREVYMPPIKKSLLFRFLGNSWHPGEPCSQGNAREYSMKNCPTFGISMLLGDAGGNEISALALFAVQPVYSRILHTWALMQQWEQYWTGRWIQNLSLGSAGALLETKLKPQKLVTSHCTSEWDHGRLAGGLG